MTNRNDRIVYTYVKEPNRLRIGAKHFKNISSDQINVINRMVRMIIDIDDAPHKCKLLEMAEEWIYCYVGVEGEDLEYFSDMIKEDLEMYTVKELCGKINMISYLHVNKEPPYDRLGQDLAFWTLMVTKDWIATGDITPEELGLYPDWDTMFNSGHNANLL